MHSLLQLTYDVEKPLIQRQYKSNCHLDSICKIVDHEEPDGDSNYEFAMYSRYIQCSKGGGGNDLSLSSAIDWSSLHNKSLTLPDTREIRVPINVMRKK